MYTTPKYRGKGLAKQLLEHCIGECKKSGVKRIWLHASEDGKPLYKKWALLIRKVKWNFF